ncbi:MAG TPA: hypothetical protein VLY20_03865 [Nitrospiria bacterium]|nr:hypothetical protein [Nitrospiria bacterium]
MKQILSTFAVFLPLVVWTSQALAAASDGRALEPYFQIGVGAFSRDIVEQDSAISGFKFKGTADSTRLIAKLGLNIADVLNLYVQGGGSDLSIDEFNNYDSATKGAYGGGLRINLYQSPDRDALKLFVEGNYLRSTTDDRVQIDVNCSAATACASAPNGFVSRLSKETIEWNEYTVLMGASGRYFNLAPNGGIRLSAVNGKDRLRAAPDSNFAASFQASPDVREQDNFGIFFGTDVFLDRSEKTALNFEVSLIDQNSFEAAIRRSF